MSSNTRKSMGGHIKRLIVRERGDVRDKMLAIADQLEAEHAQGIPTEGGDGLPGSVHG